MRLRHAVRWTMIIGCAWLLCPWVAEAEEPPPAPAQVELVIDRESIRVGEQADAVLMIRNISANHLFDVTARIHGKALGLKTHLDWIDIPSTISQYSAGLAEFSLEGQTPGVNDVMIVVSYKWVDPNTKEEHHWIEATSGQAVNVERRVTVGSPGFWGPLLLGALLSQLGVILKVVVDRLAGAQSEKTQAKAVALAFLRSAAQATREEPPQRIPTALWETGIVKANLHHALVAVVKRKDRVGFALGLAQLAVQVPEYNRRQEKDSLTERHVKKTKELVGHLASLLADESTVS